MKKKLQIFISSTYKDLQDERQAAVEAILGSKPLLKLFLMQGIFLLVWNCLKLEITPNGKQLKNG